MGPEAEIFGVKNERFLIGSIVKNLPANTEKLGFDPGLENPTCRQAAMKSFASQLFSMCSRAQELKCRP